MATFPTPLQPQQPPGSLIYESSVREHILASGETDRFTIDLDGGQTVTFVAEPGARLQLSLELSGSDGLPIAAAAAAAAGQDVVLQSAGVQQPGTHTLAVAGLAETTGSYGVRLILNAAIEAEDHGGPPNDAPASAEDLDASFIALGNAAIQRGAVLGTLPAWESRVVASEDFESGVLGDQWTIYSSSPHGVIRATDWRGAARGSRALIMGARAGSNTEHLDEAIWTVDLSGMEDATLSFHHKEDDSDEDPFLGDFTGHFLADGVAISDDGVTWHPVLNMPRHESTTWPEISWQQYSIDLGRQAARAGMWLGSGFQIKFQYFGHGERSEELDKHEGYDEIQITTPARSEDDWYRFTLEDGQTVSLAAAAAEASRLRIQLYDAHGNPLAASTATQSVEGVIHNFVDATGNGTADTYLVRLTGRSGTDYGLVVTRGSDFEIEPDHGPASPTQEPAPAADVLGHLALSSDDHLSTQQKLVALDGTSWDQYGRSLCVDGNTAMVGAKEANTGAVYVLEYDGRQWVERQKLTASDGDYDHHFGNSISIDGDWAMVGSERDHDYGPSSGAAYVFHFDGSRWIEQQKLTPSDAAPRDSFGYSLSVSGDTAIVTTYRKDGIQEAVGAAYVFRYDGTRWTERQKLVPPDPLPSNLFGMSVDLDGDTAVVGSREGSSRMGAAYVYRFDGSRWSLEQRLTGVDGDHGDAFGDAVSIDGDTMIVGAKWDDPPTRAGAAYVFRFDGSRWSQQQKLVASDPQMEARFGISVAVRGSTIAVGAAWKEVDNVPICGQAYIFRYDGQRWVQHKRLVAADPTYGSRFGQSLAINDDAQLLVGAYQATGKVATSGAAYAFSLAPQDGYAIAAQTGDALVLSTQTPGDGPGEPVNALDPRVELIDPSGVLVAGDDNGAPDGRNALLRHTAESTGSYTVHVRTDEIFDEGEYLLSIDGHTGPTPVFEVTATEPADAGRMPSMREQITVALNHSVRLDTLEPSDLTIDGTPASAIEVLDGRTVLFRLPALGEGVYEAAIAGGALSDLQGRPVEPFAGRFTIDLTPPHVIASSLLEGQVVPSGRLTYTARFDEQLNTAELDSGDVELVGQITGRQRANLFRYDPITSSLTIEVDALQDDHYTLRILSGEGRIEDLVGHDLDGEPDPAGTVPSGDGTAGGDFVVHFTVDTDVAPYLAPLTTKDPRGSLLYDASFRGLVGPSGDSDSFHTDLDAGQTISVVVDPETSLQPTIRLLDPGGTTVGSASASAAGDAVMLSGLPVATSGTYTITVAAASQTVGRYTVQTILNGTAEPEAYGGPANDAPASADDLDPGFAPLGGAAVHRAAVVGALVAPRVVVDSEDFESGVLGEQWSTYIRENSPGRIRLTGEHGTAGGSFALAMDCLSDGRDASMNEAIWTVDLSGLSGATLHFSHAEWNDYEYRRSEGFSGHRNFDGVAISSDGYDWEVVWAPPDQEAGRWLEHSIDLGAEAEAAGIRLGPVFRIMFTQYGHYPAPEGGRGFDNLSITTSLTPAHDWYRFTLADGETTSIALKPAGPGDVTLDLYDGLQNLLATGAATDNAGWVVDNFVDGTADSSPDRYFLHVAGDLPRDYALAVARNATFDVEPDDGLDVAQELSPAGAAVGYLSSWVGAPLKAQASRGGDGDSNKPPRSDPSKALGIEVTSLSWQQSAGSDDLVYAPGRLIVRFVDGKTQAANAAVVKATGAKVIDELGLIDGVVVELADAKADVLQAAAEWSAHPSVLYAEPDYIVRLDDTLPDDPLFPELWGLHNTGQTGGLEDADIDAPLAWDTLTGSRQVVVASIDTGVDYTHEDLRDNMWRNPGEIPGDGVDNDRNGYIDDVYGIDACNSDSDPMDDHGHGTHTSGTMGAVGNNGLGVTGVNWNVQIMALKFITSFGYGYHSQAIACLDYMTMMKSNYGVNVVVSNNSWGGGDFDQALKDAIAATIDAGIMFVAAAGNDRTDADFNPHYPSGYNLDGIISVAASDRHDQRAGFSNYGATSVDLAAPGHHITSTFPANRYATASGTSMASPQVAAAAALLMAYNPESSLADVKSAILDGVDPLPDFAQTTVSGGRLNLASSLALVTDPGDFYAFQVNAGDTLLLSTMTPDSGPLESSNRLDPAIALYDPGGLTVADDDNSAPDGRNAQCSHQAAVAGTYTAHVFSMAHRGEYVLHVSGNTGGPVPFEVQATHPADGAVLSAAPEQIVIDFNDSLLLGTLHASDFVIDGTPIQAISLLDGDTVVLDLPAGLPDGAHEVTIAAGMMRDVQGTPIESFLLSLMVGPVVVHRHVFYNNSAFDGNDLAAGPSDDQAIAHDKRALLPGETATFANYTSFSRGINGIMVDMAELPRTLTAADFEFRIGNDNQPAAWTAAPQPSDVALRPGQGIAGSDRLTILWPDNVIHKQWLQVIVLANQNTGLPEPDVFYFGNAIGEWGNSTSDAKVNAVDMLGARDNQRNLLNPAPIDFPVDFDRDQRVNAFDMLIARNNVTSLITALKLITVPAAKADVNTAMPAEETAHDAALRGAGGNAIRREAPFGKLDWLYEFEPRSTVIQPSRKPTEAGRPSSLGIVLQ